MNQKRSLPDKYYGENGIHRVPLWRIGCFALNNTSTNMYMFLMNFVAYYLGSWGGIITNGALLALWLFGAYFLLFAMQYEVL